MSARPSVRPPARLTRSALALLFIRRREDADVVFANSTCFDEGLMHKLALKGNYMREGAMFLTTTKVLPLPHVERCAFCLTLTFSE